MFKCFYPGVRYESVYAIDFNKYYEQGFRAILFDIDNTLVMHDAPANKKAAALFEQLRDIGFKTCLISNNGQERVAPFAQAVKSDYVCHAKKPEKSGFDACMELLGSKAGETMMIGDQLFTDMWGANRAGVLAVYTERIARDPHFYIRLKRVGESIVMIFYRLREQKIQPPKYLRQYDLK